MLRHSRHFPPKPFNFRFSTSLFAACVAAIVAGTPTSSAETRTWIGTTGLFSTPSNWSGNAVPLLGDAAVIDSLSAEVQVVDTDYLNPDSITITNGLLSQTGGYIDIPEVNSGTHTVRIGSLSGDAELRMSGELGTTFAAGHRFYVADGQGSATSVATGSVSVTEFASLQVRDFFVIGRQGGTGTMTVSDNATVAKTTTGGFFIIGEGVGSGILTVEDHAVVTSVRDVFIGNHGGDMAGDGTVNVTGNAQFNSTYAQPTSIIVGNGAASVGELNISGNGSVSTTGGIQIGNGGGGGEVNLNSGSLAVIGNIVLGNTLESTGTLNLNGGMVTASSIRRGEGAGTVRFNGAIVKAAASGDYFSGFESADLTIQSGGLKFDTNENAVVITQGLGGQGGLEKLGAGELIVDGQLAFEGATVVSAGTLTISAFGAINGSSLLTVAANAELTLESNISLSDNIVLALAMGSTVNLDFTGIETIAALSIDGVFLDADRYSVDELQGRGVLFTGLESSALNVTSAVPEPSTIALLIGGVSAATFLRFLRRKTA